MLSKVRQCRGGDRRSAREAARRLGVDPTQLWIEAQQLQGARARAAGGPSRRDAAADGGRPAATQLRERDLLALLLHVDEARAELLAVLEDEDVAHPGSAASLAALRRAPWRAPEALMAELETDAERGLLAALLVEEREWSDTQVIVAELKKRYDIRRRKQPGPRRCRQAIAQAQATGDPARARAGGRAAEPPAGGGGASGSWP